LALKLKAPNYAHTEALPQVQPERGAEQFRVVGMDSGRVPNFDLLTQAGSRLRSDELVGREPIILIFFATWCQVCTKKLPFVRQAIRESGPIRTVFVSVDDERTWFQAPDYLREQRLDGALVSGRAHPNFVVSYNPFHAVPLVVVVGQDGQLVDYQMGYSEEHQQRLTSAIRIASAASFADSPKHEQPNQPDIAPQIAKERMTPAPASRE
jgi:hypothetical protein